MEDEYIGKKVTTNIISVYKDGWWTVDHTITMQRSKDLEHWDERTVTSSAKAKDANTAMSETTMTLLSYLNSVSGDLFKTDLPPKAGQERLN